MYEYFTDRARKVMQLANQEAQRFNHEYIGTEHILLGLVKEGTGVAAHVLSNLDIGLRKVRLEVERIIIAAPDVVTGGSRPETPRAKKVIECAIQEARALQHNHIGTEHLLLGLLREEEGVAAQVLRNLGLSLSAARDEVLAIVGSAPTPIVATKAASTAVQASPPSPESPELPARIALAVAALEEAVHLLNQMKEDAVGRQDFEWAAGLRDQADKLFKVREWMVTHTPR